MTLFIMDPSLILLHIKTASASVFLHKIGLSFSFLWFLKSVAFPDYRRAARGCSKKSPDQKSLDWSGVNWSRAEDFRLIEDENPPERATVGFISKINNRDLFSTKNSYSEYSGTHFKINRLTKCYFLNGSTLDRSWSEYTTSVLL